MLPKTSIWEVVATDPITTFVALTGASIALAVTPGGRRAAIAGPRQEPAGLGACNPATPIVAARPPSRAGAFAVDVARRGVLD